MVTRKIVINAAEVAFLKGIVEAHDGLAQVFAESGGELTLASPVDRAAELDALIDDLCADLGAMRCSG
jgi:hypothetical protein